MSGETERKETSIKKLVPIFLKAIIDRVRGKDIRKQLDFLLNPQTIETSSRLKRNEIMAMNHADFLGRFFQRFRPLRAFWVGVESPKDLFVKKRGGGFARWVISEGGKGRAESINFIGASKEEKIIAPVISALGGKQEESK